MDADGHVLGALADGGVDDVDALLGELGGGLAVAVGGLLAHLLIAEVGQVGVVQLDEAAAGGVQVVELGLVGLGNVFEEGIEGGVGVGVDGVASAAEVHHGGRGDAHLGGDGLVGAHGLDLLVDVVEVVDLDRVRVAKLADNDKTGRGHAVRGHVGGGDMAALLDTGQVLQEVDVEPLAAVFTVGHGLEAVLDLLPDDGSNVLILDLAELLGGRGLALDLFTGLEDSLGAEEGPDVVRAVNSGRKRHGWICVWWWWCWRERAGYIRQETVSTAWDPVPRLMSRRGCEYAEREGERQGRLDMGVPFCYIPLAHMAAHRHPVILPDPPSIVSFGEAKQYGSIRREEVEVGRQEGSRGPIIHIGEGPLVKHCRCAG